MQKVRRHPYGLRLFVGIRFQELFHSPRRGAFHLSLTGLVRYRSLRSTYAWRVVPPCSDRIARVPPYSNLLLEPYSYGAVTRYGPVFQPVLIDPNKSIGLVRVRSPLLTESR